MEGSSDSDDMEKGAGPVSEGTDQELQSYISSLGVETPGMEIVENRTIKQS
jgi:hypothetical protein